MPRGAREIAAGDRPPDPASWRRAGRRSPPAATTSTSNPSSAPEPPQRLHVAAPPAAEAVIVADHQLAHPAALQQHVPDELLGAHAAPARRSKRRKSASRAASGPGSRGARARSSAAAARPAGFTTSSGCGSKVTRTLSRPAASARRAISCSTAWCPRWTPSNEPTVDHGSRGSDAARRRARCRLPHGIASTTVGWSRPSSGRATATSSSPARSTTGTPGSIAAPPSATARPCTTAAFAAGSSSTAGRWPSTRAGGCSGVGSDLVERHRLLDPQPADRLAAQRGQMSADPQPLAQVAADGPQVGPGAHRGAEGHRRRLPRDQLDPVHRHGRLRRLHRLLPAAPAGSCARRPRAWRSSCGGRCRCSPDEAGQRLPHLLQAHLLDAAGSSITAPVRSSVSVRTPSRAVAR